MKTRTIFSLGLSAVVLGGTMVGCTGDRGGLASAGTREAAAAAKVAAHDVDRARSALGKGQAVEAAVHAESAVALMPQNARYRALLGQAYLKAGRFASARTALADALTLEPGDGRSALGLALAEIALGDWQAARATLDANVATIPAADRGLAVALAGDPVGGAQLLTDVVRAGRGNPKTRQNLALALALAGQWQGARVVASADMSPADVDRRIEQWAAFANPRASSDQVASLLGVKPVQDHGQPIALALAAPVALGAQVAEKAVMIAAEQETILPVPAATPTDVALATLALAPIPEAKPVKVPLLRAEPHAVKVALAKAAPAKGNWYVQVGAFRDASVAQRGWQQATRLMPALARNVPTTARFGTQGGAFYRLAVGGFGRSEADSVCRRYRAVGGACFVRAAAGDQIAAWAGRQPVQLASR